MNALLRSAAAAAIATATLAYGGSALAESHITNVDVTFLLVNDIYELGDPEGRGGFAKVNGLVNAERAKGGHLIYVHAGDMISPSLLSGFDQGEHTITLTNLAAPDIFVPGNHEFDFGPDVFMERMAALDSTIMAANLRGADGNPIEGIVDTEMRDIDGVMIGIIGLAAEDSPVKSSPGDLQFSSTVETGLAKAAELREAGADLIVVVTHAARSVDRELFDTGAFDVILTGDDHDLMVFHDGRTAMVESYNEGDYVTAVDLSITVEMDDGDRDVSWWPNFRLMDTMTTEADPATVTMVDEFKAELSSELDVSIGTSETPLDSRRASVRSQETAIGNLIADAMRSAVGADIAITNGGGIRGNTEYAAGTELTRRDILTELPFGNLNLLLEVSGEAVAAALENGVSQVADGAGRFPQVSGISFDVDLDQEPGSRVSNIMVGDEPLDPAATYKLSTNDYMARGGDGYTVFRDATVILGDNDAKLMANDVMAYVRSMGQVAPTVEGRIKQ